MKALFYNDCSGRFRDHWKARAVPAALALVALVGAALVGAAPPARAQFARPAAAPREVPAEQSINLFAQWPGGPPVDGVFVTLPAGWHLDSAAALQSGGTQRTPLAVRKSEAEGGKNEYFAGAQKTLREATEIVLHVRTGASTGAKRWSLVPFTYRSEQKLKRLPRYRVANRVDVKKATVAKENHVLAFGEKAQPLLLDRARLPSLSTRVPFTVETWLKTTGLGEVVLSTWDGTAQSSYPLELVVGAGGRLRYYRGRPGHHESMASPRPVADGTWHHVAVTHDPEAGRTRLLVDGQAVDSLRGTLPLDPSPRVVALGGRVPPPRAGAEQAARMKGFEGALDEVHFWPGARSTEAVRRTMRQPRPPAAKSSREDAVTRLSTGEAGPVLLHFEPDDRSGAFFTDEPSGVTRTRSDLRFYAPVADLSAHAQAASVELSWTAPDRGTFVVERSTDGQQFREVGRRKARSGARRYAFTDAGATDDVVFYRIRQQFTGGSMRLSGTLKVGRAAPAEAQEGVTLMGNYPNPFREETTIAYQVHAPAHVHLAVWDLTGQRVATLIDKQQGEGYKEVTFRPEQLASGTYFVRLRAGGKTQTRKMALVK